MTISLADVEIANASLGSTELSAISLGSTIIWQPAAPPSGQPAYIAEAISLGAFAAFDGLTCQVNGDTFNGGTEVAGPDGLTMIDLTALGSFVEAITTQSATDACTVVCVLRIDMGAMTTSTTLDVLRWPWNTAGDAFRFRPRRNSSYDCFVWSVYGPWTDQTLLAATSNGDELYALKAMKLEPNAGTPANSDIYAYGYSIDGAVTASSPNRGNNTRPDGGAQTINVRPDQAGIVEIGGICLFDSLLTDAQLDGLAATVPSLDSLI